MRALDVVVEDPRWEPVELDRLAEAAITATLAHQSLAADDAEITLLACDDARIAALNADFRGKPAPTNVLSWPAQERAAPDPGGIPRAVERGLDGMLELGDIAISFDTCQSEAKLAGKPFAEHVAHLIVHGVLHLLGYDHVRDLDATLMERIEIEILGKLGYDDPYRVQ